MTASTKSSYAGVSSSATNHGLYQIEEQDESHESLRKRRSSHPKAVAKRYRHRERLRGMGCYRLPCLGPERAVPERGGVAQFRLSTSRHTAPPGWGSHEDFRLADRQSLHPSPVRSTRRRKPDRPAVVRPRHAAASPPRGLYRVAYCDGIFCSRHRWRDIELR